MSKARTACAALFWLLALCAGAAAQGCGSSNPNCIVPTRPPGDSTNAAASTAFVTNAVGGGGGSPITVGSTVINSGTSGDLLYDNSGVVGETNTPSVAGIVIVPVNPLNLGLSVSSSGPSSGSQATDFYHNKIQCANDVYSLPTNASAGDFCVGILFDYGGTNVTGPHTALFIHGGQTAATGDTVEANWQGLVVIQEANATAGSGTSALDGAQINAIANSGATGYTQVVGAEISTFMFSGSSTTYRAALALSFAGDGIQGGTTDAVLVITSGAASGGSGKVGILFSAVDGSVPLDPTTGCAICSDGGSYSAATGIDLTGWTFSGNYINFDNYTVQSSGNVIMSNPSGSSVLVMNDNAGTNQALLSFQAGFVEQFQFGMNSGSEFFIFENTSGATPLSIVINGDMTLAPHGNVDLSPVGGTTAITGAATVSTTLNVTGLSTLGSASVSTTLGVTGLATLSGAARIPPTTFSGLGTCNSGAEGTFKPISNSSSATFNATITTTGTNHVVAYCNGTNWTVH